MVNVFKGKDIAYDDAVYDKTHFWLLGRKHIKRIGVQPRIERDKMFKHRLNKNNVKGFIKYYVSELYLIQLIFTIFFTVDSSSIIL